MEEELFVSPLFNSLFMQTQRKFGLPKPQVFYSPKLASVSVQAILMILKNLKQNKMEPNHVTIHSKLKEFFGLQVTSKDWCDFVEQLAFDAPFC